MRKIEERYISLLTDFGFFDVYCENERGEKFIVEMQNAYRDVKNSIDTALEKGREEKAIQIAKKMLAAGMDIDTIINMTDLPKDEIEKLYLPTIGCPQVS